MRKAAAVLVAAGVVALGLAVPAQADGPPLHGHMLVLGVKYVDGEPIGFDKCIELAGGNALALKAHHAHSHTGTAGGALEGAGHAVVPTAPLSPFADCEDLKAVFPG